MTNAPARLEEPFPSDRTIRWNPLPDSYHLLAEMLRGPGDENRLVVAQAVLRQIDAHVAQANVSGGTALGLLLGELYACPVTGLHYTAVRGIERLPDELVSVEDDEITDATWHAVEPEIRRHGQYVLGWYRSRPRVLPQLPPIDAAAHVRRFRAPWQVAMLVSPDIESPAGAFYVYQARVGRVYSLPFHEMLEVHPVHGTTGQRTWVRWQNYVTDGDLGLLMEQAQKQAAVTRQQRRSGGLLDPLRDAFEDAWTRVRAEHQPKAKGTPVPVVAPPGAMPGASPTGERASVAARPTAPVAWSTDGAPEPAPPRGASAAASPAAPPPPRTTTPGRATPRSSGTTATPTPAPTAHPLRGAGPPPPRQRTTTPMAPPAVSPVAGAPRTRPTMPLTPVVSPVTPTPAESAAAAQRPTQAMAPVTAPPVTPITPAAPAAPAAPTPASAPAPAPAPARSAAPDEPTMAPPDPRATVGGAAMGGGQALPRAADYPILPDEADDQGFPELPPPDLTAPLAVVLPSGFYQAPPLRRNTRLMGLLGGGLALVLVAGVALMARGTHAATSRSAPSAAPRAPRVVPMQPQPLVATPSPRPAPTVQSAPAQAAPAPSAAVPTAQPAPASTPTGADPSPPAARQAPAPAATMPSAAPADATPTPDAALRQFDTGLARLTTAVRDYRVRLNGVDGLAGCTAARAARAAVDTGFDTLSSALKDAGTAIDVDRSMRYNKVAADVSDLERDWRRTRCARVGGA